VETVCSSYRRGAQASRGPAGAGRVTAGARGARRGHAADSTRRARPVRRQPSDDRTHSDLPAAPGAIYLFRRNLLRACTDRDELAREIRITVQHEVGHLLGLDEEDLERWGLA
jgi:hypothetical protein